MRRSLLLSKFFVCLFLCVAVHVSAFGQSYLTTVGTPTFTTTFPVNLGFVNLANGNLHIEVPISNLPGRGAIPLVEKLVYDSRIWQPGFIGTTATWTPTNVPNSQGGWRLVTSANPGSIVGYSNTTLCIDSNGHPDGSNTWVGFNWTGPDGTVHQFPQVIEESSNGCGNSVSSGTAMAIDSSGLRMDVSNNGSTIIIHDPSGNEVYPTVEDFNGNYLSLDANGNAIDTLRRTPVTASVSGNTTTYTVAETATNAAGNPQFVPSFKVTTSSISVTTAFNASGIADVTTPQPMTVISSINTPDNNGGSYSFAYDSYGELNSITLPSTGTVQFGYTNFTDAYGTVNRWATSWTTGGTSTPWMFTPSIAAPGSCPQGGSQFCQQVTVAKPSGDSIVYSFAMNGGAWMNTAQYKDNGGHLFLTQTDTYNLGNTCNGCVGASNVQTQNIVTSFPDGMASKTSYSYDSIYDMNVTAKKEWGYHASANFGILPDRETDYSYLNLSTYTGTSNILNRVNEVQIKGLSNGSQYVASDTVYCYDGNAQTGNSCVSGSGVVGTSGILQHDYTTFSSGNSVRGNVTAIQQLTNGNWIRSQMTYDDLGNVQTTNDANGNPTSYLYSNQNAYVSQITLPSTASPNAANHIVSLSYDSNTGVPIGKTDQNGNLTSYGYDWMLNVDGIEFQNGEGIQNNWSYSNSGCSVETDHNVGATWQYGDVAANTTIFDPWGRVAKRQNNDIEGGDDVSETTYDSNGRVYTVANAHAFDSSATDGTTMYSYDALDRVKTITEQDGAEVQYSYSDNTVTVKDELGKTKEYVMDGLGHTTQVWEPNESTGILTYETDYVYDPLNNLTQVTQKGGDPNSANWRTRIFGYDMLSHMYTMTTPEAGTATYHYDNNGNLTSIVDARGVTTSMTYDALNRVRSKSYSDGTTPSVTYSYDETAPWGVTGNNNTNGRLSSTWIAGNLAGAIYIYDSVGHLIRNDQCAKSNCGTSAYSVTATYNQEGDLTSLTYPSGRAITDTYNVSGRLTGVTFASYNGTSVNYPYYTIAQGSSPSNWGYWPNGSPDHVTLGNGVSEAFSMNSRLMLNQITAANTAQTFLSKTYSFLSPNNGNISQITDNLNSGRTQSFHYDYMNRLTAAFTTATSGPDAWSESYSADPWGNMNQTGNPGFSFTTAFAANNQIAPGQGYTYDAAGNLLTDTFHTYTYNGESKMTSVDSTAATYTYAPDGTRSRKDISGDYTEYVYFGGQVIAEKNSAGDWTDYIFANGQRLAKAEGLNRDLHIYGNTTGANQYALFYVGNAAGLNGYTIQSGDKLEFTQYQQTGSKGGMVLAFADGSNSGWTVTDENGYFLNDDQEQNTTHLRTVDLSSLAGKTINNVAVNDESDTAAGAWNIYFDYVSLITANGTVYPIYSGETSSPITSMAGTSGETGIGSTIDTNRGKATNMSDVTTYYVADHLGSSRMILSGNGYPVWAGVFLPFGQEWNPQITMNNYKFIGLERDAESALDHTWFRQFEATQGRWLSPDPSLMNVDLTNPQSLNRYAYVNGAPLENVDPSGLACLPQERAWFGSCAAFMNNGVPALGSTWDEFAMMNKPVVGYAWLYGQVDSQQVPFYTPNPSPNDITSATIIDLGWYWGPTIIGTGFDLMFNLELQLACEQCYSYDTMMQMLHAPQVTVNRPKTDEMSVPVPVDPGVVRVGCLMNAVHANAGMGELSSEPYGGESVATGTALWQHTSTTEGWEQVNSTNEAAQAVGAGAFIITAPTTMTGVQYIACENQ